MQVRENIQQRPGHHKWQRAIAPSNLRRLGLSALSVLAIAERLGDQFRLLTAAPKKEARRVCGIGQGGAW